MAGSLGPGDTLFLNVSAISWMSESKLPPRDRTIQIVEPSRISIPVFVTLTIVAALGIVLASSFLAVNIRFRNQRYGGVMRRVIRRKKGLCGVCRCAKQRRRTGERETREETN